LYSCLAVLALTQLRLDGRLMDISQIELLSSSVMVTVVVLEVPEFLNFFNAQAAQQSETQRVPVPASPLQTCHSQLVSAQFPVVSF